MRWLGPARGPAAAGMRRCGGVPLHVGDERLLGGLDLAATLQAGPAGRASAACWPRPMAACRAPRHGRAADRRHGGAPRRRARHGRGGARARRPDAARCRRGSAWWRWTRAWTTDERAAGRAAGSAGLPVDLAAIAQRQTRVGPDAGERWPRRGALLPAVTAGDGIARGALRAPRSPSASARCGRRCWPCGRRGARRRWPGATRSTEDDAALAGRLVLAPRAPMLPARGASAEAATSPAETSEPAPETAAADGSDAGGRVARRGRDGRHGRSRAAAAAMPRGPAGPARAAARPAPGRAPRRPGRRRRRPRRGRGRPTGVRPGEPRGGARLDLVATLRRPHPGSALRREPGDRRRRIEVRARRPSHHAASAARRGRRRSSSSTPRARPPCTAWPRRRARSSCCWPIATCAATSVALLAFRGRGAELLLPPTRSLVRAKRSLAGLPGGGGTPLAAGIDAALALADAVRRKGETPAAGAAHRWPRQCRARRQRRPRRAPRPRPWPRRARCAPPALTALLVDISPRPQRRPRAGRRDGRAVPAAALCRRRDALRVPCRPHAA